MERQPQSPEFRINPENFYPVNMKFARKQELKHFYLESSHTPDPKPLLHTKYNNDQ